MSRKVTCENYCCKHHTDNDGCQVKIRLGVTGKCESFEKGFPYYFRLVWQALGKGNFINSCDLTDDLRIGIYYVMKTYKVGISECDHGTWRWLQFKTGEGESALHVEEIIALGADNEILVKLYRDFLAGNLPGKEEAEEVKLSHGMEDLGYGWLSPAGDFTESPFGSHEESAETICKRNGWEDEYWSWREKDEDMGLMGDFLAQKKGYVLIHNPAGVGGYIVTGAAHLTKAQREFLYGYFTDKGDRFMAERYLKEEG